jgi:hypothetical protein
VVILELIHAQSPDFHGRDVFIRLKANAGLPVSLVIHDNFSNRMALRRRCFIQISALSTFDGKVVAYHGRNG